MDRVDALGDRPQRRAAFPRELLAETDDAELQQIVEQAARDLATPIALVSLVLDHIQFFKAHYGLPPELAAARGTRRDVSFCQFVVRDGRAFEVADAPNDPRVPQHLVEQYDIRSYLGVPIHAGGAVVGSLCVLDTAARRFSDEERQSLEKLAALVDERVTVLTERRRQVRQALSERASGDALAELRGSLAPIHSGVEAGLPALAAIRSFLRLSAHVLEGGSAPPEVMRRGLQAAVEAAEEEADLLEDIRAAAADCEDCVAALESLTTPSEATRLSEVVIAAQDLSRQSTWPVGGAPLPDLSFDPRVHASRPLAVALLATALANVAGRLAGRDDAPRGIRMQLRDLGATAELAISAEGLPQQAAEEVAAGLAGQIGKDPTVTVHGAGGALRLAFAVADPD